MTPVPLRLIQILPVILVLTAGCSGSEVAEPEAQSKLSDVPPSISAAELEGESQALHVRDFYAKAGWAAIWSPRTEQALTTALEQRSGHGLDRVQFLPDLSKRSAAAREIALTGAALMFADALARGVADPAKLYKNYTHPRPEVDLASGLVTAVRAGRVAAWLDSLTPDTAEYRALADAYRQQQKAASQENVARIASGDLIRPGDRDPRIAQIVTALVENRYLAAPGAASEPPPQAGDGAVYSADIVTAVKAFQHDYDIADDGVIGADTLAILNVRPGDRARSIAVAMERLRWLTREPAATRIDVNTAAAELTYFRDGKPVDQRNVVVGKPGNETPQLSTSMFRLVANPTWTVPKSIQQGELAGKSAAYFRRNNMSWRNGWIVQGSGPRNSLGLVKFDLQNSLAIYLHDTPAKSLFDRHQRQLSHGCVRVSDALGFAQMLAEQQGITAQWSRARATGKIAYVKFPQAIPVRLLYRTVYVSKANQVTYRTDPYGWNVAVAEALGFGKNAGKRFRSEIDDIGP
ncbi:murein L,D-transpeptidase [Novosphingobium sp.]|uniref:L,D-transpeptidase family protein n=1 Tax=Novosphingobium sp. TaxID=1874826 RepID=UPI002736F448|nr:L,D-transpeptidase family protein [Novosphingobium sp.]MDP3908626.1 L,D-transpeptidase family protein [Novosphingobium sp.]